MSEVYVKDRELVVPGQVIAKGIDFIPSSGTVREGDSVVATMLGLAHQKNKIMRVIPLVGPYFPQVGDQVIGRISSVGFSGWMVDIGTPYPASLSVRDAVGEYVDLQKTDITKFYDYGDLIVAKILYISKGGNIRLSMKGPIYRKLKGGKLIKITPSKIPRLIGKQGSMVNLIKTRTKCLIIAGQNGWVWISGERRNEIAAAKVIAMIDEESHTTGLTERVEATLKKLMGDNNEL